MKIVDFETLKQEKSDKDKEKDAIHKLLSDPMQSLYVSMIEQGLTEAMDGVLDSLGSMAELGLSQESAVEIMDILVTKLNDASMAVEYIADELRREESE